jgi:hypothetical protein
LRGLEDEENSRRQNDSLSKENRRKFIESDKKVAKLKRN